MCEFLRQRAAQADRLPGGRVDELQLRGVETLPRQARYGLFGAVYRVTQDGMSDVSQMPIMFFLEKMCEKYFRIKPFIVGPGIKTGLNIKYENPREVGADRIVNAVAAIHEYGSPLIIVDFGTATTYCFVNEEKQYLGGAIAPGIQISTEALYTKAAKLPRIEIAPPERIIGRNTVEAMQAGVVYGYVGQVDGIVSRMKAYSNKRPTVIATGGLAELIAKESKEIDIVDPLLTLKGLHLIYNRNINTK